VPTTPFASHRVRADLLRKVSGSTEIGKTMHKAVQALAARNIPSLIVHGYAVQENGYARFTNDVDITKVEVDLLPGGGAVGPGPLRLPLPIVVNSEPVIADLKTLIEIKLSSYMGSPTRRAQDLADVVQLIQVNGLSRSYIVDAAVQNQFKAILDGLEADA
jgi:hypothetical protein